MLHGSGYQSVPAFVNRLCAAGSGGSRSPVVCVLASGELSDTSSRDRRGVLHRSSEPREQHFRQRFRAVYSGATKNRATGARAELSYYCRSLAQQQSIALRIWMRARSLVHSVFAGRLCSHLNSLSLDHLGYCVLQCIVHATFFSWPYSRGSPCVLNTFAICSHQYKREERTVYLSCTLSILFSLGHHLTKYFYCENNG